MKPSQLQTDSELVNLFKNGDMSALEQLIQKYKDKIYTTILLLVKDKQLSDDFFQDTFIKVIETIRGGRYKDEGKFLPWVMRIAHNHCLDHFRKVKIHPILRASNDEHIMENIGYSEQAVDSKIIKRENHARVRQMLDRLPEPQREVVILRHYAELSFKEISLLTNCSINTTLGRMRYGLQNLRKLMEGVPALA